MERFLFIFSSKSLYLATLIVILINIVLFPGLLSNPDIKLNDLSYLTNENLGVRKIDNENINDRELTINTQKEDSLKTNIETKELNTGKYEEAKVENIYPNEENKVKIQEDVLNQIERSKNYSCKK